MTLDKEDIDYLKQILVSREECNRNIAKENERINDIAMTVAKSDTKLSILIGILSAIAVPLLALTIKVLFDM